MPLSMFKAPLLASSIALLLLSACRTEAQPVSSSEDWQTVNADGWNGQGFSLRLPPGWKLRELRGIDSYVGEIVGDRVRLMFDYGAYLYPNMLPYENDPAYAVTYEDVGGREAKLVRPKEGVEGITGVYFKDIQPTLSRPGRMPLVLEIHGTDLTSDQQSIALDIFRTVRSLAPETSPGSTPAPTPMPALGEVQAVLSAEPKGYVRSFRFTAEIVGGADNNPDLYCTGTRWDFGDGQWSGFLPDCPDWTPEVTIVRSFQQTHTYAGPGRYEVTFTRGLLKARFVVEVP